MLRSRIIPFQLLSLYGREALTEGAPWIGLAGPIRFDATGQTLRTNVAMGTILHGAVIPLPKP